MARAPIRVTSSATTSSNWLPSWRLPAQAWLTSGHATFARDHETQADQTQVGALLLARPRWAKFVMSSTSPEQEVEESHLGCDDPPLDLDQLNVGDRAVVSQKRQ